MDLVRRLIAFVDIAYIAHIKIKFFYPAADLPHIYDGKGLLHLWERTASRLIEMSSQEYITKN
jgi:cell division protein ZapE